jgi:hypothetical protein
VRRLVDDLADQVVQRDVDRALRRPVPADGGLDAPAGLAQAVGCGVDVAGSG